MRCALPDAQLPAAAPSYVQPPQYGSVECEGYFERTHGCFEREGGPEKQSSMPPEEGEKGVTFHTWQWPGNRADATEECAAAAAAAGSVLAGFCSECIARLPAIPPRARLPRAPTRFLLPGAGRL